MYLVSETDLRDLQSASSKEAIVSNAFALAMGIVVTLLVALLTSPPASPYVHAAFVVLAIMMTLASLALALAWRLCRRTHREAAHKILARPSRHLTVAG